MKSSWYSGKSLLLIGALVAVLGVFAWAVYPSPEQTRKAGPVPANTIEVDARPGNVGTVDRSPANRDSVGSAGAAAQNAAAPIPFFMPIDGNAKENADVNKRASLRLDPLVRILTPTSAADERWLLESRFPRPTEYREIRDPNAVLSQIEVAFKAGNLAEVTRLHDLLAAYFYEKGEVRWRDHARSSHSAFGARLSAEDMIQNYEPGITNIDSLIDATRMTQVYGDPNVWQTIDSPVRIAINRSEVVTGYIARIDAAYRAIAAVRQRDVSRGRIPYTPPSTSRPQPTWGQKY